MYKQMISFTEPQHDYLEEEAQRLGIPISELVRRIVDKYRERPHQDMQQVQRDKAAE